jgi:hypothetical protein
MSLVVNDGIVDSGVSTVTLTTSAATYTTNWDGNTLIYPFGTWYKWPASTQGTGTLSTTVSRSASYSFRVAGATTSGFYQESLNLNTYVISVTLYDRASNSAQYNQAALFEGNTQLMTLPMTSTSAWSVNHTYVAGRFMADVGFRVTGNTSTSRYVYFDDIVINVWN